MILARFPKEGIGLAVKTQYYETGYPFIQERLLCIKNSDDAPTTTESAPVIYVYFLLYHKFMTQSRAIADLQGT